MKCFAHALMTLIVFSASSTCLAQHTDCQIGIDTFNKKDYASALRPLDTCVANELPSQVRPAILRIRAQVKWRLKQLDEAIADQKESIRLEKPQNVWPLVMLSVYFREQKQYDTALMHLTEALKYDEDGPGTGPGMAVYYHTGQTLSAAGRHREAIEAFTKGIPKQPDFGHALYQRALAYEALGDRVQAKRDLFRVEELTPKTGYEPGIVAKLREYGFDVKSVKQ